MTTACANVSCDLKGPRYDLSSTFLFHFLMLRMVNKCIFNALPKFERQFLN